MAYARLIFMETIFVTRRARFCAAHRLDNRELFGKCENVHGHNYVLFVTVSGEVTTVREIDPAKTTTFDSPFNSLFWLSFVIIILVRKTSKKK